MTGRYLTPDPIGLAGGINPFVYSLNNPINVYDPMGLEIAYANHPVGLGFYHSKIKITPINQNLYKNDRRFQNFDDQGRRFATLGAGPDDGKLLAGINRGRDVRLECENKQVLTLPSIYKNEDEAIETLFKMLNHYNQNQLPYTLIPGMGKEYNSNTFIRGITEAGGFTLPTNAGAPVPGYHNTIPKNLFK